MRLLSVHLQNYRCHADLKIEFQPQFNVLVSINGRGKTSISRRPEGSGCGTRSPSKHLLQFSVCHHRANLTNRREEALAGVYDNDFLQTATTEELEMLLQAYGQGNQEFRQVLTRYTEQLLGR